MSLDIRTSLILSELTLIVSKHIKECDLIAVESIQDWCVAHGLREDDPFRCGGVYQHQASGRYLVLIADPITDAMQASVLAVMQLRGYATDAQIDFLADPYNFACHLVLHEVAHALDQGRSEKQCDEWAFSQLRVWET